MANMKDRNFKLTYFDVRALGEPIRWMFHYHGIPFEDKRIEWNYPKWFEQEKPKYMDTVGQVPVLEFDDGKSMGQSHVISRYLANELNFGGETNLEKALADEVVSMIFDLFHLWRTKMFSLNAESKAFIKGMVDMKFPVYYNKFNQILEGSGGDYILGKKLSYADFWLASFIDVWDGPLSPDMKLPIMPWNLPVPDASEFKENMSANYPKLRAHKERIMNIPQIKAWIQVRPKTAV